MTEALSSAFMRLRFSSLFFGCLQYLDQDLLQWLLLQRVCKLWHVSAQCPAWMSLLQVRCSNPTQFDRVLSHLQIYSLDLSDCGFVNDGTLAQLSSHTTLRNLNLRRCCGISDSGMKHLSTLTKLECLTYPISRHLNFNLEQISNLTTLHDLRVAGFCLLEEDVRTLCGMSRLQRLTMYAAQQLCSSQTFQNLFFNSPLQCLKLCGKTSAIDSDFFRALPLTIEKLVLGRDCGEHVDDFALETLTSKTNLMSLSVWSAKANITGLRSLAKMKRLQVLRLNQFMFDSDEMAFALADLKLKKLNLSESMILFTVQGWQAIGSMITLEDLNLNCTATRRITNLVGLTNLRTLNLERTNIRNSGLKGIKAFVKLENLSLRHNPLAAGWGEEISCLTCLRRLILDGCALSEEDILALSALDRLEDLDLSPPHRCSGPSVEELRTIAPSWPRLRNLEIRFAGFNDAVILALVTFTTLRRLDLTQCWELTASGLCQLSLLTSLRELRLTRELVDDVDLPNCDVGVNQEAFYQSNFNSDAYDRLP